MAAKTLASFSALAILIQGVLSQCLPLGECKGNAVPASFGGSFVVTCSSPVVPTGISVVSNNLYEGNLIVEGDLPLMGSVALEGTMGTAGTGAVAYGCGDGTIDIVEEGSIMAIVPETSGYLGVGNGVYRGFNNLYSLYYGLRYGNLLRFGFNNGGFNNGLYKLGYGNGLSGYGCSLGLIY